MIRRGFWLAVGAAGGIMGYRRAASLGRRASGTLSAGRTRASRRGWARRAIRMTRETRSFSRDVREGMELYMARRPRAIAPTLPARTHDVGQHRAGRATTGNDVTAKDDR